MLSFILTENYDLKLKNICEKRTPSVSLALWEAVYGNKKTD